MPQKFINNLEFQFSAAVKASPTTGSPATELGYGILQLPDAVSAILPPLAGGDYYVMTAFRRVDSAESDYEIMRVTAVDTSTPGQTRITVLRAQEGTMPTAYAAGDFMGLRMTAGTAASLLQAASNLSDLLDKAAARVALGLGNVDNVRDAEKPISTPAQQALDGKAPNMHGHTVGQISDITAIGRAVARADDGPAARLAIGAGTSNFSGAYNDLSGRPSLGTAAALSVATSGTASAEQVVKGDDARLTNARTPTAHTHTAAQISDGTDLGRGLVKAPDRWTVRDLAGVLSGFENRFINGSMAVCQRAPRNAWVTTGNPSGATTPSTDRWRVTVLGPSWGTGQASVDWGGTIGMANALLVQTVNTYSGTIAANVYQRITAENSFDLAGRVVTISGYVYHNGNGPMLVDFYGATPNVADAWSGPSTSEFSTPATSVPPGTLTPVSQTFTLSDAAARGLAAAIRATGSGSTTTQTNIYFTGLQIRLGAAIGNANALLFERRPYELELMACMRYLHILRAPSAGNMAFFAGNMINTSQANFACTYPVPMRAVPIITTSGASSFRVQAAGNNPLATTLAFQGIGAFGCMPYATPASPLTANSGALLLNELGPNASWIMFDAELY